MRSCLLDSAQPLPGEIGPIEGQTARYWPDADAQDGGVSDMSRKVSTQWAVQLITCLFATLLARHRFEHPVASQRRDLHDELRRLTMRRDRRPADLETILVGR